MNKNHRNAVLKYFPGAFCKRADSGLYHVYSKMGISVGCGTSPAKAWEDAYDERQKKELDQ